MFFSGDPSTRKRVDLGGRSTKERDRKKLLEQTRLERNKRLWLRQQNSAAIKIQKCFRGRKAVSVERSKVRDQFYETYGKHCQNVDRDCFGPHSDFFRQLLYFFDAKNDGDFSVLVETCRLLKQFVQNSGGIVSLFGGINYMSVRALVDYRVKQLVYVCLKAVHQKRNQITNQPSASPEESNLAVLLEATVLLLDPNFPWVCKVVDNLLQRRGLGLIREIILSAKKNPYGYCFIGQVSAFELVLSLIISHTGQNPCICPNIDPRWSFSSQILTIPLLWQSFPCLKKVFTRSGLFLDYIHQMALCMQNHVNVLPNDISSEFPGYACLLGNILESAGVALSQPECSFEMAADLAAVATFLLEALPTMKSSNSESKESSMHVEDDVTAGEEPMEVALNRDLDRQINDAIDPRFLLQLVFNISPQVGS